MVDYTLTRRETEDRGIYELSIAGQVETAVLTYKKTADDVIIADHTGVPKALGGRGIGTWLLEFLFADAKRDGVKIDPQCPFVAAKAGRRPEWKALLIN